MTRLAIFIVITMLLPSMASARDWVKVENGTATHRILTDVTANHCVRALSGLDRQRLHPGEQTRAAPEPDLLDTDCTWEIVGERTGWMVAVYATPYGEYRNKDLLGMLSGDGKGKVSWTPLGDHSSLKITAVPDTRGSFVVSVQDAKRGKPIAARTP